MKSVARDLADLRMNILCCKAKIEVAGTVEDGGNGRGGGTDTSLKAQVNGGVNLPSGFTTMEAAPGVSSSHRKSRTKGRDVTARGNM